MSGYTRDQRLRVDPDAPVDPANRVEVGDTECRAGTLAGDIYAVFVAQLGVQITGLEDGIRSLSYTIADGIVDHLTAAIDDGQFLRVLGGAVVGSGSDAPLAHAASHAEGGADEIDVSGLSGQLADPQTPVPTAGADTDALHVSVAGEVTALATKATPVAGDVLLIEDSDAGGVKRKITIGDLPGGGGGAPATAEYVLGASDPSLTSGRVVTDTSTVVWDLGVATQAKASVPVATTTAIGVVELATDGENAVGVVVQGNDSRLSNARVPTAHAAFHENGGGDEINVNGLSGVLSDPQPPIPSANVDTTAIHNNTAGELAAIALKAAPVAGDILVIEDSAAANAKKRITIGTLPATAASLAATLVVGNTTGGTDLVVSAGDELIVGDGTATPVISLNKVAAGQSRIDMRDAGVLRWRIVSDAGENLAIERYDSGGVLVDAPLTIDDATGNIAVTGTVDGVDLAAHASRHLSGGLDAIKLDDLAPGDDNTDLNSSLAAHGLLPKLPGGTTDFLRADGAWAAPAGGSGLTHPQVMARGMRG